VRDPRNLGRTCITATRSPSLALAIARGSELQESEHEGPERLARIVLMDPDKTSSN